MRKLVRPRLSFHGLIAFALTALIATQPARQNQEITPQASFDQPNRLIVHEWGTFTSIAGKDGTAVDWRALGGTSDLPSFVYKEKGLTKGKGLRHGCIKCDLKARVRLETPVLYFYSDQETEVSVRVAFPQGRITEWYPQARTVSDGIDWGRIVVMPGANVNYPIESAESHYYPARETEAAPVRVCGYDNKEKNQQFEKFLFYRGVGTFNLPVSARLDGDRVVVKNAGWNLVPQFVLFEMRAGHVGYRVNDMLQGEVTLERPQLDRSMSELENELEIILVGQGLYASEAKAMIKTWRDSWFEEGLRVFYIVPRKLTDAILPIAIEPRPAELTRVLVGRLEVVTPEMEATVRQQIARLADTPSGIATTAKAIWRKHGRFSEPILKGLLKTEKNAVIKTRIEKDHTIRRRNQCLIEQS